VFEDVAAIIACARDIEGVLDDGRDNSPTPPTPPPLKWEADCFVGVAAHLF
jgi:hypothetical protein